MEITPYPLPLWLALDEQSTHSMNISAAGDLYLLGQQEDQVIVTEIITPDIILTHQLPLADINYHYVQPLPANRLLLVNPYASYHGNDKFDLNAHIYTTDGELINQFCLGDEIADLQTTADGLIWTGYFFEGIYGSYNWPRPFAKHGLNQWDSAGNLVYKYHPKFGAAPIDSFYALNVTSKNEVWCLYSPDFHLVRLLDNQVVDFWEIPIKGSSNFAVWKNYVLLDDGYDRDGVFTLLKLDDNHQVEVLAKLQFAPEDDASLAHLRCHARGNTYFFRQDNLFYRVSLVDILDNLKL